MGIRVECEKCGHSYRLKDELAGKKVRCKICRAVFIAPALPSDSVQTSPAGNPIIAHAPRRKDFEFATGDDGNIRHISNHIEQHIGEIELVWHEVISDLVHVDVHWVKPTSTRPYHTLITSGMSDKPMTVPSGAEEYRFGELVLSLPPDWQLSIEAFQDERYYWPVRWLKILARFPHEYDTWLCFGHTVPNEDPPEPFAQSTKLCCNLILPALLTPKDFRSLRIGPEKTIHFYGVIPLYREEMQFKLDHGLDALLEKLDEGGVNELLDVRRASVCSGGL
jgi:hypothetical protein